VRVIFKYKSDETGRVEKRITELDAVPDKDDLVLAEGRPRQVNRVIWHSMGKFSSGKWDIDDASIPYVEVRLIG